MIIINKEEIKNNKNLIMVEDCIKWIPKSKYGRLIVTMYLVEQKFKGHNGKKE